MKKDQIKICCGWFGVLEYSHSKPLRDALQDMRQNGSTIFLLSSYPMDCCQQTLGKDGYRGLLQSQTFGKDDELFWKDLSDDKTVIVIDQNCHAISLAKKHGITAVEVTSNNFENVAQELRNAYAKKLRLKI